jgi:hypothetical protein
MQQMALREQAIAQPIRGFAMPDDQASGIPPQEAANDSSPV